MALTPELLEYIQKARAANIAEETIRAELFKVSWNPDDVNSALLNNPTPEREIDNASTFSETKSQPNIATASANSPTVLKRQSYVGLAIIAVIALVGVGSYFLFFRSASNYSSTETDTQVTQTSSETPTTSVVATSSKNSTVASTLKDCGTDLSCLTAQSANCGPATVKWTSTIRVFGSSLTTTDKIDMSPSDSGKCSLTVSTLDVSGERVTPEIKQQMITLKKQCSYSSADLSRVLTNWQQGNASSADDSLGNCQTSSSDPSVHVLQ